MLRDIVNHDTRFAKYHFLSSADEMTLGNRIAEARKGAQLTQTQLGERIGVGQTTIQGWEAGRNEPKLTDIQKVSQATGRAVVWIAFGIDPGATLASPMPDNGIEHGDEIYVPVDVFDMRASAGHGAINEPSPAPIYSSFFRLSWLRQVTSSPRRDLAVLRVAGDSMWDTLHDGDHVLIDRQQTSLRREGLFVLDVDGELYIKRSSFRPDTRRVAMKSDNPAYPTWDAVDPETVTVIGRVLWLGRNIG